MASFFATMREKWMDLEAASKHVPLQIPSEYMRVGYFLYHIQCSDATLQSTMASCRNDTQYPGGARHDFEKCAMLLLPASPSMYCTITSTP